MPKQQVLHVRIVLSKNEELVFPVQDSVLGRDLYDLVCRTIGLREPWYFGLQYRSVDGQCWWLRMDRKVKKQLAKTIDEPKLHLKVQFYPEDVEDGLIQSMTQHLFFEHVKEAILQMDIYCPAEEAVLMAAHAVQAEYGDYDEIIHEKEFLANDQLLPKRVTGLYQLTQEQWEERIVAWYAEHCAGLSQSEAEMEYLKIAQDLEMFGIAYFPIKNDKMTDLWLGIHASSLHIYEESNKLIPKVSFFWSEIKHLSFKNKTFLIEPMEKAAEKLLFTSVGVDVNRQILQLCVGNHDLYMKRRRPDSLEVQVLRMQAKEEKKRREYETGRYLKEKKLRVEAVQAKHQMEKRLREYQQEMEKYRQLLIKSEETTDLLAEKALIAEEESGLLLKKAAELETEIDLLRIACTKKDEEKSYLETRIHDTDITIQQLLQESNMRAHESMVLKQELDQARQSERLAKEKLLQLTSSQKLMPFVNGTSPVPYSSGVGFQLREMYQQRETNGTYDVDAEPSSALLSKEIQKERVQYIEKSNHLQKQLTELKTEIEGLKVAGNRDVLDRIHTDSVTRGETKYSTIQKLQAASTTARVQVFQQL